MYGLKNISIVKFSHKPNQNTFKASYIKIPVKFFKVVGKINPKYI